MRTLMLGKTQCAQSFGLTAGCLQKECIDMSKIVSWEPWEGIPLKDSQDGFIDTVSRKPSFDLDKMFALYELNTNFNLSRDVCSRIENVVGVETLDVISRYRARIGVGKMFDGDEVGQSVKVAVGIMPKSHPKGDYWVLGVLPDGQVKTIRGSSIEDVEYRSQGLKELCRSYGGEAK